MRGKSIFDALDAHELWALTEHLFRWAVRADRVAASQPYGIADWDMADELYGLAYSAEFYGSRKFGLSR